MSYHLRYPFPSAQEIARQLPGGRVGSRGQVQFQDPFDPKQGKLPCALWLAPNTLDGFRVHSQKNHDPIKLKERVRELVPDIGPFLPRGKNNGRGMAHRPAGGPVVRELAQSDSLNGGGGAPPHPLHPPFTAHDAFTLLSAPAPSRRWHIAGSIPADDVTLLGADGGEGKTTLALQLAYCTAWGYPWLQTDVRAGSAVYLSAEEPLAELHYRLEKIAKGIVLPGEPPNPFKLISRADSDAVLAVPGSIAGTMQPTSLFEELRLLVAETEAKLLVLDAAADVYGGNEIDRSQVRSFIRVLRSLAIGHDCAVLLLAHPSVDGMKTGRGYSGSTHWSNSVRSRFYFTTPTANGGCQPDQDLRQLELAKANRGRRGEKMMLRWRDGAFWVERGAAAADALSIGKAKLVFLELVRRYQEQGRNLSAQPGPSYAPKLLMDNPEAAGLSKELLAKAMNALLKDNIIAVETYGRPSRPYTRLVEAVAKALD